MNAVRRVLLMIAFAGLSGFGLASEPTAEVLANRVKAAYVFKFSAYVEWPVAVLADETTPLVIGVMGAEGMVAELSKLSVDHRVNNRLVRIKGLKPEDSINGIHVLVVGAQENDRLKYWLDGVRTQPVLTVSESTHALEDGSIINFVTVDDRIRFEVSVMNADRNGLKISSRLLGVALRVDGRGP